MKKKRGERERWLHARGDRKISSRGKKKKKSCQPEHEGPKKKKDSRSLIAANAEKKETTMDVRCRTAAGKRRSGAESTQAMKTRPKPLGVVGKEKESPQGGRRGGGGGGGGGGRNVGKYLSFVLTRNFHIYYIYFYRRTITGKKSVRGQGKNKDKTEKNPKRTARYDGVEIGEETRVRRRLKRANGATEGETVPGVTKRKKKQEGQNGLFTDSVFPSFPRETKNTVGQGTGSGKRKKDTTCTAEGLLRPFQKETTWKPSSSPRGPPKKKRKSLRTPHQREGGKKKKKM